MAFLPWRTKARPADDKRDSFSMFGEDKSNVDKVAVWALEEKI